MAQELLINVNVSGEEELPKIDKNIGNIGKTTNKTKNALTEMRKEIRNSKAEMLTFAEGSKEYNAAMQKAAAAADKMRDINDKVRVSQRDVGVVAKNVAGSLAGLAGAFSTAQGVIALFGVENDAVAKTLLKVQAAMSVASGIAQMADSIDELKDLFGALRSSVSDTNGEMSKFSSNADVIGSNLAGNRTGVEELTKSINKLSDIDIKHIKTTENNLDVLKRINGETGVYNKKINELESYLKRLKGTTEETVEPINKVGKGITSLGKTIVSTMGYMVLFTAIIAGVTYGITKLIEWINKVPEDVTIKLSLEEDVAKKIGDEYTKVINFTNDIYKAKQSGDKEALKRLEEYGLKEFGLSKDRLKYIENDKSAWKQVFKDYLKTAKDTYYNAALMKQKTDLMVGADVNLAKINVLKEKYNELEAKRMEMVNKGTGGLSWSEFNQRNKLLKDIETLREERHLMAEQGKVLMKLNFKDVYSETGQNIINAPNKVVVKSPATPAKPATPIKPDFSKIKFQVGDAIITDEDMADLKRAHDKYKAELEKMYDTTLHFSNEEKLIMELNKKNKNKYYNLTETQIADFNLKIAEARKSDLENQKTTIEKQMIEAKKIGDPEAFKNLKYQLEQITLSISDATVNIVEANREKIQSMLSDASKYLDIASNLANSFVDIYQYKMDAIDSVSDAEINAINSSNKSEEEKTKLVEQEEQKRYELKKKLFEKQKAWQIANAWIAFASGTVGIWSQSLSQLGPIAGPIVAGVETAALLATTIAQTNAISKQKMDSPSNGSSGSSGSPGSASSAAIIALSPNKTSLTSSQENLNMMNSSNKTNNISVVKVSDINNVQNKVQVRDNNTNY